MAIPSLRFQVSNQLLPPNRTGGRGENRTGLLLNHTYLAGEPGGHINAKVLLNFYQVSNLMLLSAFLGQT